MHPVHPDVPLMPLMHPNVPFVHPVHPDVRLMPLVHPDVPFGKGEMRKT